MNKYFIDKKITLITAAVLGTVSLSGCGNLSEEEQTLASFSSSIADFTDYIQEADAKINSLDVSKRESASELLMILDDMDAEFAEFARIKAPDQYESVPGLAMRASEEMSKAVSYYHTAYESEEFNVAYADAAYTCYSNSMKAVGIIGILLTGQEIPEDDHVTVYEITNDEHILDKWLSGDKEGADENETTSEWLSEAVN